MSEPLHAVVRNGAVVSVDVCDAATASRLTDQDVFPGAQLVDVTDADPAPGAGWTYDGSTFTAPPAPEPTPDAPRDEPAG